MSAPSTAPDTAHAGGKSRRGNVRAAAIDRILATALPVLIGLRFDAPRLDIPTGYVLAGVLLPVTWGVARRYRGVTTTLGLVAASALAGLVLTLASTGTGGTSDSLMLAQSARIVAIGVGVAGLVWARHLIGTRRVVLWYAVGDLASAAVVGVNWDNPWKFTVGLPIMLLVLAHPRVYGRPRIELAALVVLAVASAVQDSRSAAGILLIAAVVVGRQRSAERRTAGSIVLTLARLVAIGVAGFLLVQAAVLEGVAGDAAQARTQEQIDRSGSVLVGGRPEMGATFALMREYPWGLGTGALASPTQVREAKLGMWSLGYNPNNRYVEQYMFGRGFEVHSLLGDLWVLAGPLGLLLALWSVGLVALGLLRANAHHLATGVLAFLAIRSVWDLAFSPFPTVMRTLVLAIAVAVPLAARWRPPEGADGSGVVGSDAAARVPGRRNRSPRSVSRPGAPTPSATAPPRDDHGTRSRAGRGRGRPRRGS